MVEKKKELTDWDILKNIENQQLSDQLYNTIIEKNFSSVNNWFKFGLKCNINDSLFKDLDMFDCFENDGNTIIDHIDHSITPFGKEFTKKILSHPTDNVEVLKLRQETIRKLVDDDDLYLSLKKNLGEIKTNYKNTLWFLDNHDEEVLQFFQKLFFENQYMNFANNNCVTLSSLNYLNLFIYPFLNVIYPLSSILLPYHILRQQGHQVTIRMLLDILVLMIKEMISDFRKLSVLLFTVGCYLYNAYKSLQNAYKCYKMTTLVKSKICSVINIVNCSYNMTHSINTPFYHNNMIDDFKSLEHLIINKDITDSVLNPSCFESNGELLKYFYHILHNKRRIQTPLVNVLQYVGYLDHLYSMATLIRNKKWTFPVYLESNKPLFKCMNLWHPCLQEDKVVYNSIDLKKNVILTGPNAGGKSTFIKNILLNITLSQTLGICNSQALFYTPFHLIYTHINIPDNKGKESLFEAEVNRISSYIKNTRELYPKQYGIGVFDEILTSTNVEEGLSVAKSMCNEFNQMDKCLSIITTHFGELAEMELDQFKNYKVVVERENNDIQFLYKVEEGISDQKIAIELLRKKGFDNKIIENAIQYQKK